MSAMRIAQAGTFDVGNYGDLLFPILARHELGKRLADLELTPYSYRRKSVASWAYDVLPVQELLGHAGGHLDGLIVGGGHLVRFDKQIATGYLPDSPVVPHPAGYWLSPTLAMAAIRTPVVWNAVGVSEPPPWAEDLLGSALGLVSYLSVRDEASAEKLRRVAPDEDVVVAPDTAFGIRELASDPTLDEWEEEWRHTSGVSGPYVVLQSSPDLEEHRDEIGIAVDRLAVQGVQTVELPISPDLGDSVGVLGLGHRALTAIQPWPRPLQIARVIAGAEGVIARSLHLSITAIACGVPVLRPPSRDRDKYATLRGFPSVHVFGESDADLPDLLEYLGRGALDPELDDIQVRLGAHWDRVALTITEARAPTDEAFRTFGFRVPAWVDDLAVDVDTLNGQVAGLVSEADALASQLDNERAALANAVSNWEETARTASDFEERLRERTRQLAEAEAQATARLDALDARRVAVESTLASVEHSIMRADWDWTAPVAGPPVDRQARPTDVDLVTPFAHWLDAPRLRPEPPDDGPVVSVVVPVFDPPAEYLEACIRSVRNQTYRHWELVLVDVSAAPYVAPTCKRFTALDDRIRHIQTPNAGIASNTDHGVSESTGEWIVLLDHDDELVPHALAAVVDRVLADDALEFLYSDEAKLDPAGVPCDPFFKPDWSPDLLRTVNYIGHLVAIRRTLWDRVGGMRPECDGAQDWDMVLRATHLAGGIGHIPDILYFWRQHEASTAGDVVTAKPYTHSAGRRALQLFSDEFLPAGTWVDLGPGPTQHRLRYPLPDVSVSIIIPFRDGAEVTERCLESIANFPPGLPFEVLLVDNQSRQQGTFDAIATWQDRWEWVRCVEFDEPFNYHRLNNWAVEQTSGDLLLFLNNDTEALHHGWAEAMAEHACRPEVGVVGARLFYPDGLLQHAGVVIGIGGFADHPWSKLHPHAWTAAGPSTWTRNFLSVTAACMMVERTKFLQVGAFDDAFHVCGGDVDLGLRLHQAGYQNVYTPFARLVHHESATRDRVPPDNDVTRSLQVYAPYLSHGDPYYNPNLSLADTACRIGLPPSRPGRRDI